ncbi:hypothetical protein pah_c026o175 [Parachlamydia acanthamoebae str. Hall's coccus]|nr:hypothetical protein pah_c026o175 [Parachlamydia acanthamoebae str. Hall's coccus]
MNNSLERWGRMDAFRTFDWPALKIPHFTAFEKLRNVL